MNFVETLVKIKKNGILGVFKFILYRFFNTFLIKLHYLYLEIDIDNVNKFLDIEGLNVKELELKDFLLGDPFVFNKKKMEVIKQRFQDSSYKSYGIIENNILVYSTWISYEKLGLPIKSNYKLASNEALLEDSYCDSRYRGKGIHSKMNIFRIKKIFEEGKSNVVAIVMDENLPAFKVQIKSGFNNKGFFYAGRFLGIPFVNLKLNNNGS
jgi:hypothetical protein